MIFFTFFILLTVLILYSDCILYPQFTVIQIVAGISWPINTPNRKVFMNVGFQFNYNMPFLVSSFISPTYLAKNKRELNGNHTENSFPSNLNDEIYKQTATSKYNNELLNDISAGELYRYIENILLELGYEKSCLLKSVCEMSLHPFQSQHSDEHLITELIQFILTPSLHQSFNKHENFEKEKYETAELIGSLGYDCDDIYDNCSESPIKYLTRLETS